MTDKAVKAAASKLELARDISANAQRIADNLATIAETARQAAIAAEVAVEVDEGSKADAVHKLDRKRAAVLLLQQRHADAVEAATEAQDAHKANSRSMYRMSRRIP